MINPDEQYQSYLMRMYRPGPGAAWRVILESIPGGVMQGFASLEEAFAFLSGQSRAPRPDTRLAGPMDTV